MSDERKDVLKVTLEELEQITTQETRVQATQHTPGARNYGNINTESDAPVLPEEKGSVLLQGWFYLGSAGLLGALAGWGIAERGFVDGQGGRWGNLWMVPAIVTFMCVGFAVSESLIERSLKKALIRAGLSLPLGIALGFVFEGLANVFYALGMGICASAGVQTYHNPAVWIARGIAWMVFGVAGGVVYGIVGKSMRKTGYGALGGAIGAGIGGMVFDPIAFATHGGAASRAVGFGLLGLATGVAMGLVESALKDRWLYVTAGPLAGKQFILYKPQTSMGSEQSCDIYLFKDAQIQPHHALLQMKGSRLYLAANGPTYISGQPVRSARLLESGAIIQIGRYSFRYQEKQR